MQYSQTLDSPHSSKKTEKTHDAMSLKIPKIIQTLIAFIIKYHNFIYNPPTTDAQLLHRNLVTQVPELYIVLQLYTYTTYKH